MLCCHCETAGSAVSEIKSAGVPLGFGLQTLDRQIDFSVLVANDHDLHILALCQVLPDITDIGVGDFGNMYHAGLVLRQGNESAKIGDGFDFPL